MDLENTDARSDASWFRQRSAAVVGSGVAAAPSGYRVVKVDTPSSAELRDLVSYRRDLELAKTYADAFRTQLARSPIEDRLDVRLALWVAALTTYGRTFNGGTRHSARVPIDALSENGVRMHEFFLALRNKHVAHAVNGYEDADVIAYITDSAFMPRRVTRTGQVHHEQIFASGDLPRYLSDNCETILLTLKRRVRDLHYEVSRELSRIDLDEIYGMPDLTAPTSTPVTKPRRQARRTNSREQT
ncbi:hypothetical protein [Curtobacterium sp. MCLR17_040]|uniref:hypothetical protein n=1 Tax=Curtobacterium sp. MCLR17_040 TaxID=2175625 RepID=UPI0011B35B48|nr:hypothetical protein [Curtobacterium sp. MCLR17_040]